MDNTEILEQPLLFVRTPLLVEKDTVPVYKMIERPFTVAELGDFGRLMEKYAQNYAKETMSLQRYLEERKVTKTRGRPKKSEA